jgi:hypothetical protein
MESILNNPGYVAHRNWEQSRGSENECDAERRIAADVKATGADMPEWWKGWFERSDEWREEIGHEC